MLLEQLAPTDALARDDRHFFGCAQPRVFAAIQQVCPREIAGFGAVGRFTPFVAERPLYAQMLGAGYTVLGTVPLREVVIGRVGVLARPFAVTPRVRDKRAFNEYTAPGHVKVLLGFSLAAAEHGGAKGTAVEARVRLWRADGGRGGLPALGWPLLGPIAGAVSRAFLAALAGRVSGDASR